jgi:hypothetical protein
MTSILSKRPDAATYAIEDLVPLARNGTIRIPAFQRLFKWRPSDIRDLFDSVYRGFPVGTLLFWKKAADAGTFFLGPVEIEAKAQTDALWIVDGQQRISSLVGVLAPSVTRPEAAFDLHFDLAWEDMTDRDQNPTPFHSPDSRRGPEPSWLPMSVVLDSERLDAWLDESGVRASHPDWVRRARRLNKLTREYKIPAYVVETEDTKTLGLIFDRVNTAGRRLDRSEVFNALLRSAGEGYSLPDMARRVHELGFGELDQDLLLKVVLATNGIDVTTAGGKQLHELSDVSGAIEHAESALVRAIDLVRRDARIPHEALLPYSFPLIVLARFFRSFPSPSPRSRALLARWVWRGAVTGEHRAERIPAVRAIFKGLAENDTNEDGAVQTLIASVPRERPEQEQRPFRFGTAQGKLDLLGLASLGPRDLFEGDPLDVGPLLATHGGRAVLPILATDDANVSPVPLRTLPNLLIHPPASRRVLMAALATAPPEILMSHGFDAEATDALRSRDYQRMIEARASRLSAYLASFVDEHARWNENDRPSLAALLGAPAAEDSDE